MIKTEYLTKSREKEYEDFLVKSSQSSLYYSLKYRDFLKSFIEIEDKFIIALVENKIVGAFPAYLKINPKYGNVLNSSCFYGSHGGAVIDESLPEVIKTKVKKALLAQFLTLEKEYDCISSTIVSSPFEKDLDFYRENYPFSFNNHRLAQILELPPQGKNRDYSETFLQSLPSSSLRRNIRRAKRHPDIKIFPSEDLDQWQKFWQIHQENMLSLSAVPKPFSMLLSLKKNFTFGQDYRIYLAELNGEIISGLLVIYFNKTAEYFMPAVKSEHRKLQTNTLIIFQSMVDAAERGCQYYNFGGTSKSQQSLYEFKARWGSKDLNYEYFVKYNREISYFKKIGRENIAQTYEYFFVVPFDLLTNA